MDNEETGSGKGFRSAAKIIGLALRNTALSFQSIMWEIPYRTLLAIMLSSRYIPDDKTKKKEEVSTPDLMAFAMSKGKHHKGKKKK